MNRDLKGPHERQPLSVYSVTITGVPSGAFSKNGLPFLWQANAYVRLRQTVDVTLVQLRTAIEKHAIGHSRSIEMLHASRPAVFARVDVRFHTLP
jgi:hypothetical protein